MPNYRRPFDPGGVFFFTVVAERRVPVFSHARARRDLRPAIRTVQAERPFEMTAIVLLPEHLHCIWRLPEGDSDFSTRWSCLKRRFTQTWLGAGGVETDVSASRRNRRERGVWQKRFWDHRLRNEDDMIHHVNYIHYNPIKHGLVRCPHAWPWSSFHRWVKEGYYRADWLRDCSGGQAPPDFTGLVVPGE